MGEKVAVETNEDNFAAAMKYALAQGHIVFDVGNFRGWMDSCNCVACRSQRIIYNFLFDDVAPRNKEG